MEELKGVEVQVKYVSLQVNPQASLSMSLAQTDYCRQQGFDPQSPLCAHIILSGSVMEVLIHTNTQTHTHLCIQVLQCERSHDPPSSCPGERHRGGLCKESSVQSTPGDDRLAV